MLLPLYQLVEESKLKRSIVKLSLLLTLSRTVWIGLFLAEVFRFFYVQKLTPSTFIQFFSRLLVVFSIIALALAYLDYDISFIFDPSLGGRAEQFKILSEWNWIGSIPFQGFSEITYLSVLNNFGLFGLITFLIALTSPLWIYAFFSKTQTTSFQRSLIVGLCTYLCISCSDGATLHIPVMTFYWFVSAVLLRKSGMVQSCIPNQRRHLEPAQKV
jgi:hypothetical protein